jgi:hypothetical protein
MFFVRASPASIPRSRTLLRGSDCIPKFGPVVEIVSVTTVACAPVAIELGLNPQAVNAGKLLHAKFTAELKVEPPTGVAENV